MAENLTFNLDVDSSKAVSSINTFFDAFDKGAAQAKSKLNTAFGQTIQTDIRVEFKNGKLVAKEVQSLKQESNRLATAYKAVNGELGKTPNELKKQNAVLKTLLGNTQKFKGDTRAVTAEWKTLTDKIKQVDGELKKLGQGGGGGLATLTNRFIGIQTAANLATSGIMQIVRSIGDLGQSAMRMETLSLQLEAFTGSAEGAESAFSDFAEIAAKSPFTLEQVASAGKIMMAFGVDAESAIKATEQLGIVAAASGGDLNLLARNMGQIVAQGRAYTRDLTQFAIQGVPIWESLSVVTGKSVSALKEMAREGQIGGKEVTAALESMTQKGTAFYEVAQRMQETFAGRFAKIASAADELALAFVNTFNELDDALGNVVTGSMKAFADGILFIAENLRTLTAAIGGVTAGMAAFAAVSAITKLGGMGNIIAGLVWQFKLWSKSILGAVIAKIQLLSLMGPAGWAQIAAGVAVAAVAYVGLSNAMKESGGEASDLNAELETTETKIKSLEDRKGPRELVQAFKDASAEAEKMKGELDAALAVLEAQKKSVIARYKAEQMGIKDTISQIKEKISIEKSAYADITAEIKTRYDSEKNDLDDILDKVRERQAIEMGDLQKKGPAEQQLYDFQKKQLELKIRSGELEGEALLSARARLERMVRQEQIDALRVRHAAEQKKITDQQLQNDKSRTTELEAAKTVHEETIGVLEEEKDVQETMLKTSESMQKKITAEIDRTIQGVEDVNSAIDTGTQAVNNQIGVVQNLTEQYRLLAVQAQKAFEAANKKAQTEAEAAIDGPSAPGGKGIPSQRATRASGGPVSGGSAYTVNELGKEAFLSASGGLSMINAPSYGTWRAPGAGTVIPAHLTKQLDIPSGGVNINKKGGLASAAGSGGMNMNALAGVIAGALGGDTVTNNVTIQSANTTQAASDVMVQLAKLKRLRYN